MRRGQGQVEKIVKATQIQSLGLIIDLEKFFDDALRKQGQVSCNDLATKINWILSKAQVEWKLNRGTNYESTSSQNLSQPRRALPRASKSHFIHAQFKVSSGSPFTIFCHCLPRMKNEATIRLQPHNSKAVSPSDISIFRTHFFLVTLIPKRKASSSSLFLDMALSTQKKRSWTDLQTIVETQGFVLRILIMHSFD